MILKNVIVNWAFISEPDDEGFYRVQFEISKKSADYELLIVEMQKCMIAVGKKKEEITWWSGFKEHETDPDIVLFNAKTRDEYKDKRTNEIKKKTLPVFDIYAKRYADDAVPRIANGAVCNVEVSPYFASFHNKHGIMLGLRSVQLMQFEIYSQNPYQDETNNQKSSNDDISISYKSESATKSADVDADKIPF